MNGFGERLIAWQIVHGRHDLPWQQTRDPYPIWISEIMLQQTQVSTVIPYYQRFLRVFPTVTALAAAPLERVLELWSGLGYYSRARNLHRAAQLIVSEYRGEFPRTVEAMSKLPGIGRSTAAAICTFSGMQDAAILDGNAKRVLARYRGIEGYPGDKSTAAQLWAAAHALLPARDITTYTQALMDLGAMMCTRTDPACLVCPVQSDCVAFQTQRTRELPTPRPKRPLPAKKTVILLLERHGEILLEKRAPIGIWGGLWSLPEVAVQTDIEQYCRQRFHAKVRVRRALPAIEHSFTHFKLTLVPRPCVVERWSPRLAEPGLLWLTPADARGAALPAPIKRLLIERAETG